jgi:colanic acid/amylovoran biosynthesis protein
VPGGRNLMRIVVNNVLLYNGGDAAIAFGLIKILANAFGKPEVTILDTNGAATKSYYPELDIRPMPYFAFSRLGRLWRDTAELFGAWFHRTRFRHFKIFLSRSERETFELYRTADLVVATGGTYLVENYDLKPRLFELELAVFAKKPLIFFTQSLGPFSNPRYIKRLSRIFAASPLILLRDEKSKNHLLELGVSESKIRVASDGAFALADPSVLMAAGMRKGKTQRIAVSVRDWQHFRNKPATEGMALYKHAISCAIEFLVNNYEAEITFISSCQGIRGYWADDSRLASEILLGLPVSIQTKVKVDASYHSPLELVEILKQFDLTISTRMHMAILSLCAGTPVFPIAYEFKTTELFKSLGMGEWVVPIDEIDETSIVKLLPGFLDSVDSSRRDLFLEVSRNRDNALSIGKTIRSTFAGLGTETGTTVP